MIKSLKNRLYYLFDLKRFLQAKILTLLYFSFKFQEVLKEEQIFQEL